MTLLSFTPTAGRLAGATYFLPPYDTDQRTNKRQSTFQTLAMNDGVYDSSGSAPMPLDAGDFSITFEFTPAWYVANRNGRNYYNGTSDDMVARENAILHFMVAMVEGGEGLLVDDWSSHPGIIDPVTNSPITSYQTNVKVSGDVQITRTQSRAQVQCAFSAPGSTWVLSTGVPVGVF